MFRCEADYYSPDLDRCHICNRGEDCVNLDHDEPEPERRNVARYICEECNERRKAEEEG